MQSADCILSPMQSADCAGSQIACNTCTRSDLSRRIQVIPGRLDVGLLHVISRTACTTYGTVRYRTPTLRYMISPLHNDVMQKSDGEESGVVVVANFLSSPANFSRQKTGLDFLSVASFSRLDVRA